MTVVVSNREKRTARDRRLFLLSFGACLLVAIVTLVVLYGPAYTAYWNYSPQEGDVLFQSLPHAPLVNAIEGVSESPYSHCGIVTRQNGRWMVCEALHGVEMTPLREFIFRGRNQGFAVYRLKTEQQKHVPQTILAAQKFLGRPYDSRYRMDDEQIYCSELIYKAYGEASGERIGELVRMGDLNWRPFEETIQYYEGGPVPLDREMITPKNLANAEQLELVFAHRIHTD
ncbi:MAG: YiiX/YebB-like N1pC/P60 family cysteine hydrolase [Planctomycetaceae bacterium]